MAKQYFTLTGCNHYFGNDFMKKGMKVKLKKEPKNEYDAEAIMVKMKGIGKVGYVANSAYTVQGDTMSAGRLYDKIGKKAKAKIVYVIPGVLSSKLLKRLVRLAVGFLHLSLIKMKFNLVRSTISKKIKAGD